ncbi:MAG TPA: carboxypeptidase-like regulatory domain-containing protein [Blastocatellia bacterium]|nr:carboxypeptidase-like regulatory domain-containing protein [Blastocatellia bacterium]
MRRKAGLIKWRGFNFLKNFSLALVCCVCATAIAPAQSINGRITGTITDQAGAVISNAVVTLTNEGTGAQRRATPDENGSGSKASAFNLEGVKTDQGRESRWMSARRLAWM